MDLLKENKKVMGQQEWFSDDLSMVCNRFDNMKGQRWFFEDEWDICDQQFRAPLFTDPYTGTVIVNSNIEQNLIEAEIGRTSGSLNFDVKPSGYNTNTEQLESARYALQYYIDKENWYDERRTFRQDKARYGTAVFYTGLRNEIRIVPKFKKQKIEVELGNGIYDPNNFEEVIEENWYFTPRNVPIRQFFIDDRKLWQNNFGYVEDCIMLETMTKEEFVNKYRNIKHVDEDVVNSTIPIAEDNPAYGIPSPRWLIILYHYYNKITKDYIIMVNRTGILFKGKMLYAELPFVVCQHYPDSSCIYGISIPRKVRMSKAYKNNQRQSVMDGARIGSGKILLTGMDGEIEDGFLWVKPGNISIAKFNNSIDQLRDIDTRVDLNWPINSLGLVDKEIREATGLDLNSPFEAFKETLWQTEIREENKAIRQKGTDELMNQCLDKALTMMLDNIARFAPVVLRVITDLKVGNSEMPLVQRPKIQIKDVKVMKKKGKQYIEEDYGSYGYLELNPETLTGDMTVNVITPSTFNATLSSIQKERQKEFINNLLTLSQVYWPEVVQEIAPFEKVWELTKQRYGYEDMEFVASTKKDKIRMENEEKIKVLQQLLSGGQWSLQQMANNETTPTEKWQPVEQTEVAETVSWSEVPAL